ncbi:myb-related transcription factor, partner of profilin-like [Lissotriton helveticus]
MASGTAGEKSANRKRKLKFSKKEIVILIEEVVMRHDKVFGKQSLQVPESEKHKIWLGIQSRVNAEGVTHRTIEDLCKRWYDLRSRAKEGVATRLVEAKKTGGGPQTQTGNTPLEDLVESTLQPDAVVGVTELDTSAPASTSQDAAAQETVESEGEDNQETQAQSGVETHVAPETPDVHPQDTGQQCHHYLPWK